MSELVEKCQCWLCANEKAAQAAEIERLTNGRDTMGNLWAKEKKENERLKAALRPFAKAANGFDSYNIKNPEEWFCYGGVQGSGETAGAITVGDLRRARAALGEKTDAE